MVHTGVVVSSNVVYTDTVVRAGSGGRGFKDVVLRDMVLRARGAFNRNLKAETLPRP